MGESVKAISKKQRKTWFSFWFQPRSLSKLQNPTPQTRFWVARFWGGGGVAHFEKGPRTPKVSADSTVSPRKLEHHSTNVQPISSPHVSDPLMVLVVVFLILVLVYHYFYYSNHHQDHQWVTNVGGRNWLHVRATVLQVPGRHNTTFTLLKFSRFCNMLYLHSPMR